MPRLRKRPGHAAWAIWPAFDAEIPLMNSRTLPKIRWIAGRQRPAADDTAGATMTDAHLTETPAGSPLPLLAAADLQDDLMTASNDLERLQRLLSDACDSLMVHFYGASGELQTLLHDGAVRPEVEAPQLHKAMEHMAGAITAMQFQDMASQLINHTSLRLRSCADRLAAETMGDDEDGVAVVEHPPLRPNPVTQDEMDAGSIELF
jgi:hypothetical protein